MLGIPQAQGDLPQGAQSCPHTAKVAPYAWQLGIPQVFRRLVDDGLMRRLPCLLLTACGFPDYASRAALRRAADALDVPVLHPRLKKSACTSDWPMCVE